MAQLVFVDLAFNFILVLTSLEKIVIFFLDSEVTSGFRSLPDIELLSPPCVASERVRKLFRKHQSSSQNLCLELEQEDSCSSSSVCITVILAAWIAQRNPETETDVFLPTCMNFYILFSETLIVFNVFSAHLYRLQVWQARVHLLEK